MCAPFGGCSALVTATREMIGTVCNEYLRCADSTAQLTMVVQELLENLAKYSRRGLGTFEFDLRLDPPHVVCRICTQNEADPRDMDEAHRLLSCASAEPDPSAFYRAMVESSRERERSRLGLLRIRAEVGLVVSHTMDGGNLRIMVTGTIPSKAEARC